MPEETKPLQRGEFKGIIRLPLYHPDFVERAKIVTALEAHDEAMRVTIRDLQAKVEDLSKKLVLYEHRRTICHGTVVAELDGKPMPGTVYDGTDGACPGWWRGHDNGAEGAMKRAEKTLHDANNRIMIAEAKTERLTEKLETIAETEGE